MGGPPDPREARSEGKRHDPAIHLFEAIARRWMGGSRPPMEDGNKKSPALLPGFSF
jgi:hypothetical protein